MSKMQRFRDMTTYWSKIAEKPTPLSFGTFLWGDPLRIFRRLIPCQKLDSWGYQICTFHDPAFAVLGTIPACDGQTDGHVAVAKTRYSIYAVARKKGTSTAAATVYRIKIKGITYQQLVVFWPQFIIFE